MEMEKQLMKNLRKYLTSVRDKNSNLVGETDVIFVAQDANRRSKSELKTKPLKMAA